MARTDARAGAAAAEAEPPSTAQRLQSLSALLSRLAEVQPAVFACLGFSDLEPLAWCEVCLRSAIRKDSASWGTRLVSQAAEGDGAGRGAGAHERLAALELGAMLQRREVDAARRERGVNVDGCEALAEELLQEVGSSELLATARRKAGWPPSCPKPTSGDAAADRRARQLVALPPLRCALFAPYLCHLSATLPPTREEIRRFVRSDLCGSHASYWRLSASCALPFWVYLCPESPDMGHSPQRQTRRALLSWTALGPPRFVKTPEGLALAVPPGVASGRDSRVFLSAFCHELARPELLAGERARAQQQRERAAAVSAIERQCRVVYGRCP